MSLAGPDEACQGFVAPVAQMLNTQADQSRREKLLPGLYLHAPGKMLTPAVYQEIMSRLQFKTILLGLDPDLGTASAKQLRTRHARYLADVPGLAHSRMRA